MANTSSKTGKKVQQMIKCGKLGLDIKMTVKQ